MNEKITPELRINFFKYLGEIINSNLATIDALKDAEKIIKDRHLIKLLNHFKENIKKDKSLLNFDNFKEDIEEYIPLYILNYFESNKILKESDLLIKASEIEAVFANTNKAKIILEK